MKATAYVLNGILAFALILATGCTSEKIHNTLRADAAPLSDFLPDHALLAEQPATFPFHYLYLDESVASYENLYVAPVDISSLRKSSSWAEFDMALSGQLGTKIEDLRGFMRKAYEQAFQKRVSDRQFKIVDDKNLPKTLVLEPALIALVPTKAELNAAGIAASFVLPGIGIITSAACVGSITVECRISDAQTGKIVAMYGTTENDPRAILPIAQLTWTSSARINIKTIAANTAKVLAAKDYRTVRRDFPVKFASLIKDGNLDKEN